MIPDYFIREMVLYFKTDVRRINHALKVLGFAQLIAETEGLPEEQAVVTGLAAVFHDIGIHEAERKYGSTAGKYQELEGPPIVRELLNRHGVSAGIVDRVCYLVGHHHSYAAVDGLDFQILVEADFLVNIHEDNMERPAIVSLGEKYFKTSMGGQILHSMYPD